MMTVKWISDYRCRPGLVGFFEASCGEYVGLGLTKSEAVSRLVVRMLRDYLRSVSSSLD